MSTHNLCFIAKNVKVIVEWDVKVLTCTHNLCFEQKREKKKELKILFLQPIKFSRACTETLAKITFLIASFSLQKAAVLYFSLSLSLSLYLSLYNLQT